VENWLFVARLPAARVGSWLLNSGDALPISRGWRPSRWKRPVVGSQWSVVSWEVKVFYKGKEYYLGLFDDEVEAAKVRDRKAYELAGPFVYLNFPEDFKDR